MLNKLLFLHKYICLINNLIFNHWSLSSSLLHEKVQFATRWRCGLGLFYHDCKGVIVNYVNYYENF